ncbi:hypothetical protein OZX67_02345 [Bifidobacterium sp. ESL0728]|uniref:hypothetical protein n=1 Tax=Bifidobacterium sp. ESL0728 TaxID=2983220 RepID=UPI0023F899B7|nr:hypothetical protein [Bifidobacterium sp. ESL0728]WEV59415.1 hypothetical protein OZX67_02345 [Bifidobacterium sp. ESL0728]
MTTMVFDSAQFRKADTEARRQGATIQELIKQLVADYAKRTERESRQTSVTAKSDALMSEYRDMLSQVPLGTELASMSDEDVRRDYENREM